MLASYVLSAIMLINPTIDKEKAREYATSISSASETYKIDALLIVAIVSQESSFRPVTVYKGGKPFDIGLMQVNRHTAKQYEMDLNRLQHDPDYQIHSGTRILADKIKLCKRKPYPWACYHSTTEVHKAKYETMVKRYLLTHTKKRRATK